MDIYFIYSIYVGKLFWVEVIKCIMFSTSLENISTGFRSWELNRVSLFKSLYGRDLIFHNMWRVSQIEFYISMKYILSNVEVNIIRTNGEISFSLWFVAEISWKFPIAENDAELIFSFQWLFPIWWYCRLTLHSIELVFSSFWIKLRIDHFLHTAPTNVFICFRKCLIILWNL